MSSIDLESKFKNFLLTYVDKSIIYKDLKNHLIWSANQVRRKSLNTKKVGQILSRKEKEFKNLKCFGDVYFLVYVATYKFRGCGPKYCYDLTRLISRWLNLQQKFVYVNKKNTRILKELGIVSTMGCVEKKDLPKYLQNINLETVQDFLTYGIWG